MSEEFGTFFEDAVRSLNVEPGEYFLSDTEISILYILLLGSLKTIQVFKLLSKRFLKTRTFISPTLKPVMYLRKLQP